MTSNDSKPPAYNQTPLEVKCHCSAVTLQIPHPPKWVNECLCSICYSYGALWAYYKRNEVLVTADAGAGTDKYIWGDRDIEFHRCRNCGCITHWWPTEKFSKDPAAMMGVNMRLAKKEVLDGVRRESLDPGVECEFS